MQCIQDAICIFTCSFGSGLCLITVNFRCFQFTNLLAQRDRFPYELTFCFTLISHLLESISFCPFFPSVSPLACACPFSVFRVYLYLFFPCRPSQHPSFQRSLYFPNCRRCSSLMHVMAWELICWVSSSASASHCETFMDSKFFGIMFPFPDPSAGSPHHHRR